MSGIPANAHFLVIIRKCKGESVSGMEESGASRSAAETNSPGRYSCQQKDPGAMYFTGLLIATHVAPLR